MNSAVAADTINILANFLSRYYGRKVIILLDEYDTPMQEAWLSGYWDEAVAFFFVVFLTLPLRPIHIWSGGLSVGFCLNLK